MRLDHDLVRLLLLAGENHDPVDLSRYTDDQINYHRAQLIEAGLAKGHISIQGIGSIGIPWAEIYDLTWEGHSFLANARNNTFWERTKREIARIGGSVSFDILTTILSKVAADSIS